MSEDAKTPVPDTQRFADEASKDRKEVGGPKEANPTRYGDWTVKGRCIDF